MSTIAIGIAIILIILFVAYAFDYKHLRTAGWHREGRAKQWHIVDQPTFGVTGLIKDSVLPFDGMPNGEIYDNVEHTASASQCADICVKDSQCDSFTYMTMDGLCQKRRNTQNGSSTAYWLGNHKAMRVPGRELKADMLREQSANNADECAKVCMSDTTCSVADFNETTKSCRLGSSIVLHDAVSGVIPARRTAVDLASTS